MGLIRWGCPLFGLFCLVFQISPGAGEEDPGLLPQSEAVEQLKLNTGYVLSKGEFEINLVFDYSNVPGATLLQNRVEFQYGLSDRFMIELEVPFFRRSGPMVPTAAGFGDIELALKAKLFKTQTVTSALGVGIEAPTGSSEKGFGGEEAEIEFFWATSVRAKHFVGHFEIGTKVETGEPLETFYVNAGIEVPDPQKPLVYQLGLNFEREDGENTILFIPGIQIGLSGKNKEGLSLGIGFPVGSEEKEFTWGIIGNFEIEF